MTPAAFESLEKVEAELESLAAALVSNDDAALTASATRLRDAMVALASAWVALPAEATADIGLASRIKQANLRLADCRDSMARRSAGISRALASILPEQAVPTYGAAPGLGNVSGKRLGSRFS